MSSMEDSSQSYTSMLEEEIDEETWNWGILLRRSFAILLLVIIVVCLGQGLLSSYFKYAFKYAFIFFFLLMSCNMMYTII